MAKWEFPSANNTGTYGLRSYQEEFKDNPMLSLAKEICQNSLDAVNDSSKPVIVEFNYFEMPSDKFPGREEFSEVLDSCEYFCKTHYKRSDSEEFYKDAKGILGNDEIACLRISDFNTKGLSGSDDEDNSDWTNLVKAIGVSDKGDGKGGSFGHGKFATFACSYLQTVFYSTNCIDGKQVSQGVARLSSFYDDRGEKTLGLGYYGERKCSKMIGEFRCDPDFYRPSDKYGTDIYIMGFKDDIWDWKEKIVASVIDTFFVAIINKKLVFKFGNDLINEETIVSYIENPKYIEFYCKETLYNFYSYNDEDKVVFKGSILNEDDVIFYFKQNNDVECPNHVSMVRMNGMKIYDQDRMPQSPFYGGTLIINNRKTDSYLRSLENPQHNGWSIQRAKDQGKATEVTRNIRKFIRDSILSYIEKNQPDFIDIGGLSEFLPDDSDTTSNSPSDTCESIDSNKTKKVELKKVEMGKKNNKEEKKSQEDIVAEIMELEGEEHNIPVHITPDPIDDSTHINLPPNPVDSTIKLRTIKGVNTTMYYSGGYYNLSFNLSENAKEVVIDTKISGETMFSNDLIISDAKLPGFFNKKNVSVEKNKITIRNITNPKEVKLQFRIDSDEVWPIEVSYYAIEK